MLEDGSGNAEFNAALRDQQDVTRTPLPAVGRMSRVARAPLYPLRFDPIFTTNLWGGRRLPAYLNRVAPHADPIGEAWVLSDVDGSLSRVTAGPLAGLTLRELLATDSSRVLGSARAP